MVRVYSTLDGYLHTDYEVSRDLHRHDHDAPTLYARAG